MAFQALVVSELSLAHRRHSRPTRMRECIYSDPCGPGLEDTPEVRERYYHLALERLERLTGESVGTT